MAERELEELRRSLDNVIYSWSELSQLLNNKELAGDYYPFVEKPEEILLMLINWRSSLD